jgi:uncharacterized protein (TIGR02646 family)
VAPLVRLRKPDAPQEPLASVLKDFAADSRKPGANGRALWDSFSGRERNGHSCKELLLEVLVACSAGRCCYCEFGEPTSVEHFWPKSPYPAKAFDVRNLMPVCVKCNGVKTDRFPLDAAGSPVLLDLYEFADDPLGFLAYTAQGGIDARRTGADKIRADETIGATALKRQWLADRRKETRIEFLAACEAYRGAPSVANAERIATLLSLHLYHRGMIRYLLETDDLAMQAVQDAASSYGPVADALARPPYTWP